MPKLLVIIARQPKLATARVFGAYIFPVLEKLTQVMMDQAIYEKFHVGEDERCCLHTL